MSSIDKELINESVEWLAYAGDMCRAGLGDDICEAFNRPWKYVLSSYEKLIMSLDPKEGKILVCDILYN